MKSIVYETPVNSAIVLVAPVFIDAAMINELPSIFKNFRQSMSHKCHAYIHACKSYIVRFCYVVKHFTPHFALWPYSVFVPFYHARARFPLICCSKFVHEFPGPCIKPYSMNLSTPQSLSSLRYIVSSFVPLYLCQNFRIVTIVLVSI